MFLVLFARVHADVVALLARPTQFDYSTFAVGSGDVGSWSGHARQRS
jgi:hypothetical protein